MLSPIDLTLQEVENADYEKLESLIDTSIKRFHGWYPWEEAIIDGELSVSVRNELAQRYKAAGWKYVYHQTSSENGERAGLTAFKFSENELDNKYVNNYYKI